MKASSWSPSERSATLFPLEEFSNGATNKTGVQSKAKRLGQFFTPNMAARSLVSWSLRKEDDRILDPACGDGEFLSCHPHTIGIEVDAMHAASAKKNAPSSTIHRTDFFEWAETSQERFEAVVGNPPFIRYQGFAGRLRERALRLSERIGARISALTSSWAPFIAVAASLLKPGGRLAFVVPAEIGHASYAIPLLEALCGNFDVVHIVAVREKLFPELSEDAWLLYCEGFGSSCNTIHLTLLDTFQFLSHPPKAQRKVSLTKLRLQRGRLRRWILPDEILSAYDELAHGKHAFRFGDAATVGIGYVTGANDFFHLRPSQIREFDIPEKFLRVTVRKGKSLPDSPILLTKHVKRWIEQDEAIYLLMLTEDALKYKGVQKYLDSPGALEVRKAFKVAIRDSWFIVPGVIVPDGFLTYMSGERIGLVANAARCVGTNSVHVVTMRDGYAFEHVQDGWNSSLTQLSCEIEGHPLGGGMLKVEPREAQRIAIPHSSQKTDPAASTLFQEGIRIMRLWRHYPRNASANARKTA